MLLLAQEFPAQAEEEGMMDRVEALAEAWASIDGKLDAYRRERDNNIPWEDPTFTGHYYGYQAEAEELLRRLESRGYSVIRLDGQV